MSLVIVGIEKNIPWSMEGRSGKSNRLYCEDTKESAYTRQNGAQFEGKHIEIVKIPSSIDASQFAVGDEINVYYNRFGNVETIDLA